MQIYRENGSYSEIVPNVDLNNFERCNQNFWWIDNNDKFIEKMKEREERRALELKEQARLDRVNNS